MPGPIPMRSEDLARPEYDANRKGNFPLTKGVSVPSEPLNPNESWEPVAKNVYNGAVNSGIAAFYEASDWAMLYLYCDELSKLRVLSAESGKTPAMMFQAISSGLTSLGLTEGERRRMRIELETGVDHEEDATVTAITTYREKLAKAFEDKEG